MGLAMLRAVGSFSKSKLLFFVMFSSDGLPKYSILQSCLKDTERCRGVKRGRMYVKLVMKVTG